MAACRPGGAGRDGSGGWPAAASPRGLPLLQKLISGFMLNGYFQRYFRKSPGSQLI